MTKEVLRKIFILPVLASLFMCALLIKNAELTIGFVKKGMENCFLTVIPSLFPFMIISEMLSESGILSFFGKFGERLSRKLFGLSSSAASAVLLGLLLGFPMGTKALVSLYDQGEISQSELERAIGFSGIPSFAFIVNAVGISLLGSKRLGIALYISALSAAIISGIIFKPRKVEPFSPHPQKTMTIKKGLSEIITGAISSATNSTILLCAYVIFFSAVVGCISSGLGLVSAGGALLGSFLELSTGASSSAAIGGRLGIALCGFTIGWSGLSVHFQTAALVGTRLSNYFSYALSKLLQGMICCLSALAFSYLDNLRLPEPAETVSAFAPIFPAEYTAILLIFFFICAVSSTKNTAHRKSPKS